MRIRKRSIDLLSSSTPSLGKMDSTSHGDDEQVEKKKEREEFLLPLVAAVMDVQAKAEKEEEIGIQSSKTELIEMGHGVKEIGVRKRRAHNWRDALVRFGSDSDEVKEGDKSDCRWDMIMSRNPEDKFKRVEYKTGGTGEAKPSSVNEEIAGLYSKCELPESGLFEKSSTRAREQDLAMDSVEKKKVSVNGGTNGKPRANRSNQTIFKNSKPNIKIKSENCHGGSQCKRRNGRGWRCSQRTLVGYSLCEHHLGKSRFKLINSSEGLSAVNNKGSKFKELHLVHDASPKVGIR